MISYLITTCGASILATMKDGLTPLHIAWYINFIMYDVYFSNIEHGMGDVYLHVTQYFIHSLISYHC